jgi:hypothetical protein
MHACKGLEILGVTPLMFVNLKLVSTHVVGHTHFPANNSNGNFARQTLKILFSTMQVFESNLLVHLYSSEQNQRKQV